MVFKNFLQGFTFKKPHCFLVALFLLTADTALLAQDTNYARKTINQLCSKKYHGRGYTKNGAIKASAFIAKEMKKAGLICLPGRNNYFQKFNFTVNVIEKTSLEFNGKKLRPGNDYIADAAAIDFSGEMELKYVIDEQHLMDSTYLYELIRFLQNCEGKNCRNAVILFDTLTAKTEMRYKKEINYLVSGFRTVSLKKKLTWTVSVHAKEWRHLDVLYSAVSVSTVKNIIRFQIKSRYFDKQQQNVLGYVKGTENADSFIFVTAHYDHLGMMGKTAMFPGANDNACGVAMLLDLAKYYARNPQKYSMVFVAFAGEEAGLIGSEFYSQNPLVPLNKMRFLMNLDLVGTGEEGGTVVNATVFKKEFSLMDSINSAKKYLPKLVKRNKAANSDHYFFTESGVPSFFLYLAGPRPSYHDVNDIPQTITLAGYNGTFRLVRDLFSLLQ